MELKLLKNSNENLVCFKCILALLKRDRRSFSSSSYSKLIWHHRLMIYMKTFFVLLSIIANVNIFENCFKILFFIENFILLYVLFNIW